MEFKEFVKKVLVDLISAVDEAGGESSRAIGLTNTNTNDNRTVEFDIAVTVEEKNGMAGPAGIKVFQSVEGGAGASSENKNSTISRIKFGVQVSMLKKGENFR